MLKEMRRMNEAPVRASLSLQGVPETMLWQLWNRGAEMRRRHRLIEDPMAAELLQLIDYDFAGQFGKPSAFHSIRARYCDDLLRDYLARHPEDATVVALGEGLETQLWRVGDGVRHWFSVDLPEAIQVRRLLLPVHPKARLIECSALDPSWMDEVPGDSPPFLSAAGLLMYFKEAQVRELLNTISIRLPGADLFFDTITQYVSEKTQRGMEVTKRYTVPSMPWGITLDALPEFLNGVGGVDVLSITSYFDAFPSRTRLYRWMSRLGPLRRRFAGGLVHVRLGRSQ